MKNLLCISILVLLSVFSASACDNCGIFTPLDARELVAERWSVGVREDLIGYGKIRYESERTSLGKGQNLKANITELEAGYDMTNWLGFDVAMPFPYYTYKQETFTGIDKGSEGGFGDMAIYTILSPMQYSRGRTTFVWQFFAGAKLPTGDTKNLEQETMLSPPGNVIRGRDITLGSGSTDVPLGSSFLLNQDSFIVQGLIQYNLRTEGDYGFQYGNDLRWRSSFGYLIDTEWFSVTPALLMSGMWKDADQLEGQDDPNSEQTIFLLGPAVSFNISESVMLSLEAQFPVVLENEGLQALQDHTVRMGLAVRL